MPTYLDRGSLSRGRGRRRGRRTASYTVINVGDTWQTVVSAAAVNEILLIKTGTHRHQTVTPKTGQQFIGEAGAIMSGAKLLTSPTGSNPWVYGSQTQQGSVVGDPGTVCEVGHARCVYPEDVFIDNVPLEAVATVGAGAPGKFFFDYVADTISIWDDPTGKTVETSVTPFAFLPGGVTGVTIAGLIIEKYATPTGEPAVRTGTDWVVDSSELRYNHFSAIAFDSRCIVKNCNIHHNGCVGLNGSGDDPLVDNNTIAYNNFAFFNSALDAAGTKFVYTDGLVISRNFSHHNRGAGLWTDINNINTVYEYNTVEDNAGEGIFHEVSYAAIIRFNTSSRNGTFHLFPGWVTGGGIVISSSPNVEVHHNTLVDNWQGIGCLETGRSGEGENHGPWLLQNLNVHDNTITQTTDLGVGSGITGIVKAGGASAIESFGVAANNHFENNDYFLGSYADYFNWDDDARNETEWVAYGHDDTGSFTR